MSDNICFLGFSEVKLMSDLVTGFEDDEYFALLEELPMTQFLL